MAALSIDLRIVRALVGLRLQLNRAGWIYHALYLVVLPCAVFMWATDRGETVGARSRIFVGALVFGALMAVTRHLAQLLAFDQLRGLQVLMGTTPVSRRHYALAHYADAFLLSLVPLLAALVLSLAAAGSRPSSATWIAPYALGIVAFSGMGVCIAAWCGPRLAPVATNALVGLLLALCPLVYSPERVPDVIEPLVSLLPPTLVVELMAQGWRDEPLSAIHLSLLVGWTSVLAFAAHRVFPWSDGFR